MSTTSPGRADRYCPAAQIVERPDVPSMAAIAAPNPAPPNRKSPPVACRHRQLPAEPVVWAPARGTWVSIGPGWYSGPVRRLASFPLAGAATTFRRMGDTPWTGDACSLVDAFRRGERSPVEELEAVFTAIDASPLNAFSHVGLRTGGHRAAGVADVSLPSAAS